jgi:prepilin-type N-terminal cleavage/methylation domain-containing protein
MSTRRQSRRGFTLVELMFSSALLTLVLGGVIGFFVTARKMWYPSSMVMGANLKGGYAINRMVYGVNATNCGLRAATQSSVSLWSNGDSWTITYNTNRWVMYNGASNTLTDSSLGLLARNVVSSTATVSTTGCTLDFRITEGAGPNTVTNRFFTFVTFRN